jgi:uncharacterized protein (DUF302 family)
MDYYIARVATAGFDDTLTRTVAALKKEGFGVLTEIDVAATLKENGINFRGYRILGPATRHLPTRLCRRKTRSG